MNLHCDHTAHESLNKRLRTWQSAKLLTMERGALAYSERKLWDGPPAKPKPGLRVFLKDAARTIGVGRASQFTNQSEQQRMFLPRISRFCIAVRRRSTCRF